MSASSYLLGLAARLDLIGARDIKLLDHQAQALIRALRRLIDTLSDKPTRTKTRAPSMKLKSPSLKPKV